MATYDVQVSRVVRLTFVNIEAASAEEAALLADGKAKGITDCIVRGNVEIDPGAIQNLPPGTLASVRDANMNTEFVVDLVRNGVPARDGRFIRSHRFAPELQPLAVAA